MTLPTLYLIRHGLATLSKTGYGDQVLTAELLPQGLPAITRLAEFMKTQPTGPAFRSELKRCQQTAALVSEATGQHFVPDSRLNEYNAESYQAFAQRVTDFWEERCSSGNSVIWLCTHGAVISTLKQLYFSQPVTEDGLLDYPSTAELWIFKDGQMSSQDFNEGGIRG